GRACRSRVPRRSRTGSAGLAAKSWWSRPRRSATPPTDSTCSTWRITGTADERSADPADGARRSVADRAEGIRRRPRSFLRSLAQGALRGGGAARRLRAGQRLVVAPARAARAAPAVSPRAGQARVRARGGGLRRRGRRPGGFADVRPLDRVPALV